MFMNKVLHTICGINYVAMRLPDGLPLPNVTNEVVGGIRTPVHLLLGQE